MSNIHLFCADCLEMIPCLQDKFRLVLCDLPYGITSCDWDKKIDLVKFWEVVKPILTPDGSVVMFGSQPFTTDLIMSNRKMFKYCWSWVKNKGGCFILARKRPISFTEDLLVFQEKMWYNAQMTLGKQYTYKKGSYLSSKTTSIGGIMGHPGYNSNQRYPRSILHFKAVSHRQQKISTQKPVELLEYLIKTYTDPGDYVLDPTMGSGSTGEACKNTNRSFVGIEMSEEYYEIARKRLYDYPIQRGRLGCPINPRYR